MNQPIIFVIDDDVQVLRAITRDLKNKFRQEYRVLSTSSAKEILGSLLELKNKGETVAMFISDQRMPEMQGVDFLTQAMEFYDDAKKVLLTAYSDTDAAIKAINTVKLDYYLTKPWDPPEQRLYPVIDELLLDWRHEHPDHTSEVRVVGHRWSERSHEVKTFLARNHVPYRWYDVERDGEGGRLAELAGAGPDELPLVLLPDADALRAPSNVEVADALGLDVIG